MQISTNKDNIKHHVEEICSRSPRYAGTEGEAKTREYIIAEGEKLGISVDLEEFEYLHYWPTSSKLETLAPTENALDNLPLCYAGSGVAEGEAVYAGSGTQEEFALLDKEGVDIKGKIVLVSSGFPHFAYPIAQQYGVSGLVVLTDAPGNLCRAGTATTDYEAGKIPAVLVSTPVGQRLLLSMSTGRLKLRVTLDGEFSKKTASNIVMTIPGATIPDEQVVLTSHYDSHNLGGHAWDNASGCAAVLELARVFSQLKPVRTIKAIFFGVEELGECWGSFSYVEKHENEILNIRAIVTFDGLGNPYDSQFQLWSTEEIRNFASGIARELGHDVKEFNLGVKPGPISDCLPFQNRGVPAIWLIGEKTIFFHTAGDNPETLDYDKLKLLADIDGEIAYRIATQEQLPYL